jgi:hypothetical protein
MITLQQDTIYMGTAAPASGGGGSGDAVWGSITGTLSNQTDLANALADKQDVIDANNKLNASYVSGLATVATTGEYGDLSGTPDLSNYVTTNTEQNITGIKTFVGDKRINFKQGSSTQKLGFTMYDSTGKEACSFEYRPNTINTYPLLYLGQYRDGRAAFASSYTSSPVYVGFRNYELSNDVSAAYMLVAPLARDAQTPFSLTSTYQTFYLPLGVTDGTTMVTTNSTGVLDISSLIPSYSAFGGATGSVAGSAGLVPAPAATDNDKYLKGDGTWATVSSSGLQNTATGTGSLTILSEYPTSSYNAVNIGTQSEAGDYSVAIGCVTGDNDYTTASIESVAIGWGARAYQSSIAIGSGADANSSTNSIAIGSHAYLGNNSYDSPSIASGDNAVSIGVAAVNHGNNSVAIGCQAYVDYDDYDYSIALGYKAIASSDYSFDVAFGSSYRYKLLDGKTGKIPNDRINGVSGSFTSQDGKTVTVTNGVITSIV